MPKPLEIQKCDLPTNLPTDMARCSRISASKEEDERKKKKENQSPEGKMWLTIPGLRGLYGN